MPEPSSLLLLAHTGHWIVWVLYALPVLAVAVAIWISARRAPSAAAETADGGGTEDEAGGDR